MTDTDPTSSLDDWTLPSTWELFGRIRRGYGVDLRSYRPEALRLQLQRRMHALGVGSLTEYLELTSRNQLEFGRLLDALLVGSTAFFRDPLSFDALRGDLTKAENPWGDAESVRAWVAGCSTGEEAYSLAMLLTEVLAVRGESRRVRVYATDLRKSSLERARRGVYAAHDVARLGAERLATFFVPVPEGHRVCSRLRDCVVFGQHDLLADPPFCKLDLISCRNVLLYLNEHAQRTLLQRFHFGLRPRGVLFLGPAESTACARDRYRVRDREHRVYGKILPQPPTSGEA